MEFEEEVELLGDGEVEEDEGDGEDEADESLREDVQGHDGGEGEAGEEGGFYVLILRKRREGWGTRALGAGQGGRIAVAMAHLSRDRTAAKMGHPVFHPNEQMRSLGTPVLFCFVNSVEGYKEEVDG